MAAVDLERARFNMIEQQIRPWDVSDARVLAILSDIPREKFVPEPYPALAFADTEIPLGLGEQMMEPKLEAKLLQALDLNPQDRVLEIGTGSGFLTACLAKLAGRVTTLEIHQQFTEQAAANLERQQISNVEFISGDFFSSETSEKLPSRGYTAIAFTGSLSELPEDISRLLDDGGRIFAILGDKPIMRATLITKSNDGTLKHKVLFDTLIQPLHQEKHADTFEF